MAGSGLVVRDVSVGYGAVRALRQVSLEVPDGSVVTVLGANGAGKSTLLRALSRTLSFHGGAVTGGGITFDGRPLERPVDAGVCHVPEGRRVFARMTVADNLRAGALGARGTRADRAAALDRVHRLFPVLAERARQPAGLLSGGEQQMLAVGRALMAAPRLLLLDEPSLGLAPQMAARIARTIGEINEEGTAVLLVEQNAALALRLATHAYVLEVGEVTLAGPAAELAASDEVRRRYLGVVDEEAAAQDVAALPALPRWGGRR
ncbi:ABC transporter ATP-binding protein [Streptomyces tsukubensis]|uniref:ABC transporter ATP-binding protein n=1 Tax=Streptomyces tsukubensis TaxID=83656 RepID=A0A1V4AEY0_9ACTN|nr:ABC transporter ATP-binding protein [Streptomyces tsukubensis]OON82654.1 ABC transporter ATP-binding protein [Streptomyces tsukubensis]QFR92175.1 ATP-binding cassette domain-containing protein [Streptomyces tsukubensis]